jgi:myosin-7
MGLGDEPEVLEAKALKKKLVKQNKAAETMEEATKNRDRDALKALLAEAESLGLAKRFAKQVKAATAVVDLMDLEDQLCKALDAAFAANDDEAFEEAAKKAEDAGCAPHVGELAETHRATQRNRRAIISKIGEALEAEEQDKDLIQALIDEAAAAGIESNSKVQQAQQVLEREKKTKDTRKALKKAMKAMDDKALAEALEQAIALGMKGEEVTKAQDQQKRLEEERELASGVKAALKSLSVKSDSKAGVQKADLKPLMKAIEEARENGLAEDSPFLQEALKAKERLDNVLKVQKDLQDALDAESMRKMKKALDAAEDLELGNSPLAKKVKSKVREMEKAKSKQAMEDDGGGEGEAVPSLDDEEMKRLRAEKERKASAAKYNFTRYSKIRTPDDFASGIFLNKKKTKANQLRWQASSIPTSVLDYSSKELVKVAKQIHKDILGYTGDKSMSFPPTLAVDILQKGLEFPELVDEIYIQLCKHLTHNPRPEGAVRAWQLMCMCVGTFPPSRDFEFFLTNFILEFKAGAGAVGNYARYSLRRLEGIINSGPSGFVPSVDEIGAYKERPPILATISLVDGTSLTEDLPITPDLNVAKVLDICNHFMDLQDDRMQYFGIFVEDIEDEGAPAIDPLSDDAPPYAGLPKTPRPLQNENFMGDVVTIKVRHNQAFRFVYKRKLFIKNLDGPSEDPMFERLTFLQAQDSVLKGDVPIDSEDEAAEMAALAMATEFAADFEESADYLVEMQVQDFVPATWREMNEPEAWAEKVVARSQAGAMTDAEPTELQARYVAAIKDHPLYGTCFFHVRRHKFPAQFADYPAHVLIALNSEGLHFLNEARETLSSFGYADIYRWGGSSTQFNVRWGPPNARGRAASAPALPGTPPPP